MERKPAIPWAMRRAKPAKGVPHQAWRQRVLDLYDRLERGSKGSVFDDADSSKQAMTHLRKFHEGRADEMPVAVATLDSIRRSLNRALSLDESDEIPAPFAAVRSKAHEEWIEAGGQLDEEGRLAALREWVSLGQRLEAVGQLEVMLQLMRDRAEHAEGMERSNERISAQLRTGAQAPSGSPDKTGNGPRRSGQR